jgi:hypothetical protein
MRLKFQEILLRKQRRFVTAGEAAGVMRSGSGYSSTAAIYLSLKTFFLVVLVLLKNYFNSYININHELLIPKKKYKRQTYNLQINLFILILSLKIKK